MNHTMNYEVLENTFTNFVDTAAMQAIFQKELPGFDDGGLTITNVEVLHTHYKYYLDAEMRRRSFFIACYRLLLIDEQTQRQGEQLLSVKAFLDGRSRKKFLQIDQGKLCPPRFGTPVVHLPAQDMIVWSFPNDAELPHLPLVADVERVRQYLPMQTLPLSDDQFDITVQVVRYKPGKRCTIRYIVQDAIQTQDNGGEGIELYGKMVADESVRSTYQQLMHLWRHSLAEPKSFGIAQPLGFEPQLHFYWQAAVTGTSMLELLCPGNESALFKVLAQGLADLHESPLRPPARQEISYHLASVQEHGAELAKAYPRYAKLLDTLMAQIEQTRPELSPEQERPIHRDFHIEQLLVHENRLFIFDFDDLSMGDPMQDLAFFIVDLHHRKLDAERVTRWISTCCQAYQAATEESLPIERLNWHLQVQFLAKAYWLYKKRQQKKTIQQEILRTLRLAQQPFAQQLFVA
jgi:aminoglycoside phosphotransferase (APT) family kinase protein